MGKHDSCMPNFQSLPKSLGGNNTKQSSRIKKQDRKREYLSRIYESSCDYNLSDSDTPLHILSPKSDQCLICP